MTEVQKGNFGKTIPNHSSDETALLIDHFNAMTLQIEELTQKKQMAEILYKDAQIAMLQGQINPHFLYNTLEMIKGIAQGESAPVVRSCCNALSKIFRYNLKGAEVVPLAADLDQAKAYIHIMELRFEDVFAVAYDIDETVLTHKSVKFTFQPFLENAIVHGFANKLRGGLLTVDVHRAGDTKIRITITDNGCGIEPEKLESIQAMLEQKEKGSDGSQNIANHIGIGNTHMRLYNWFGKDYSLQMESKTGEGTRVTITIPAV